MTDKSRCVFVAHGELHAQQVCGFLGAAGIAAIVRGESLRLTHALTLDGPGSVEVLVSSEDADRARALIASAEAGELRLPDEDE